MEWVVNKNLNCLVLLKNKIAYQGNKQKKEKFKKKERELLRIDSFITISERRVFNVP